MLRRLCPCTAGVSVGSFLSSPSPFFLPGGALLQHLFGNSEWQSPNEPEKPRVLDLLP